jgi:nitrate/nitrite transport system substrate-binding protein
MDPFTSVHSTVVPPPLMEAHLRVGNIDGYCAGEPWNQRAIANGAGFSMATSQQVWPDHPEKVLGVTALFAASNPKTCQALIRAVLEASQWLDQPGNRHAAAAVLARPEYVDCPEHIIDGRLAGEYENGLGQVWQDEHPLRFCRNGAVNFPYLSDGMWFLTQHRRWGLLNTDPDYLALARQVQRIDLYTTAAQALGLPLPSDTMRTSCLMDGKVWDGSHPAEYAAGFAIHHLAEMRGTEVIPQD